LKKNRRRLDPTEEEEDGTGSGSRSGSVSPPTATILASPRQEMKNKVRQISRGVEDITWKGVDSSGSDKNEDVDISSVPLLAPPTVLGKPNDQAKEDSDVDNTMADDHETPPDGYNDTDIEPAPSLAPPITLGKETEQFKEKESARDTDKTMADDYETPPKTPEQSTFSRSIQDVQAIDTPMVLASPMAPNHLRTGSENEKGLKRKYLERGTSHGPPESGEPSVQPNEPLKRPRDGSDQDDNPREAKRPSPPPSPPRPSPPSPKIPKLVC
jgi:Ran-binding protein 3